MLILPIGQEQSSVRRLPWVTFAVMGLCVAVFLATLGAGGEQEVGESLEEAVTYWISHSYLELDPRLEKLLVQNAGEDGLMAMREFADQFGGRPESEQDVSEQQAHLDGLVEAAFAALDNLYYYKWGLVPSDMNPFALITHMFLHGGLMHLLGNMLILFLAGPFIEDVWGRPLYAGFYVVSGIAAALTYAAFYPSLEIPMIGASGAIAGVMGAFLVRHATSRIKFFYMVGFVLRGTFLAPAWLMLPLWLLQQVFMGMMMDGVGAEGGGGVAYWAHVGGFAWGAIAAFAIKGWRIEERFIHPAIDQKVTVVSNPVIDEAYAAEKDGRPRDSFQMLAEAWRADPGNDDVAMTLWNLALRHGWSAQAAPAVQYVIERQMKRGETDTALDHWFDMISQAPGLLPPPRLCLAMARANQERGQTDWVLDSLRRAAGGIRPDTPPTIALKIARMAAPLDAGLARQVAEKTLGLPGLAPEDEQLARSYLSHDPVAAPLA